jgi:gluconolactonase
MKKLLMSVVISSVVGLSLMSAQTPNGDLFERADPAMDQLIAPDAKLEVLANHFGFLEGPVWIDEGPNSYLAVTDMAANVIYKWTPDGDVSVLLDRSGYTGYDIWRVGMPEPTGRGLYFMIGSNGLALDAQGRLVIAGWASRSIKRLEPDGSQTTLADRYDGKRFGGPNDLVVKKNGTIYFTDGVGGLRARGDDPSRELMIQGVYMLKDGAVTLVDEVNGANGIMLSPDERTLYASSGPGRTIMRYDVQPDDSATTNGRLFFDRSKDERTGIIDGMKVDSQGNIWTSCCGGVHILTPEGKPLGMFRTPVSVTNLNWGGSDWKTLYITARTDLYRIRTLVAGIPGR